MAFALAETMLVIFESEDLLSTVGYPIPVDIRTLGISVGISIFIIFIVVWRFFIFVDTTFPSTTLSKYLIDLLILYPLLQLPGTLKATTGLTASYTAFLNFYDPGIISLAFFISIWIAITLMSWDEVRKLDDYIEQRQLKTFQKEFVTLLRDQRTLKLLFSLILALALGLDWSSLGGVTVAAERSWRMWLLLTLSLGSLDLVERKLTQERRRGHLLRETIFLTIVLIIVPSFASFLMFPLTTARIEVIIAFLLIAWSITMLSLRYGPLGGFFGVVFLSIFLLSALMFTVPGISQIIGAEMFSRIFAILPLLIFILAAFFPFARTSFFLDLVFMIIFATIPLSLTERYHINSPKRYFRASILPWGLSLTFIAIVINFVLATWVGPSQGRPYLAVIVLGAVLFLTLIWIPDILCWIGTQFTAYYKRTLSGGEEAPNEKESNIAKN